MNNIQKTVLAVAAMFVLTTTGLLSAAADWNYIILSSYYVYSGQSISVSGAGFAPNESITISGAGTGTHTTASSAGTFTSPPFTIPTSVIGSSQTITAVGNMGHVSSASLTVATYYPHVTPSSYFVNRGSTVSFSGVNFGPNEQVNISLGGNSLGTATTDNSGNFSTGPLMISYSSGNATFNFTGQTSHTGNNVTIKISDTSPVILLNSYYAAPGSGLQINGQFFGSNEGVNISYGGNKLGSATTTAEGNFSFSANVPPNTSSSPQTITATGISTGLTAQQVFTPNTLQSSPSTQPNQNTQVSIVSVDRVKSNLSVGNTQTTIAPTLISTGSNTTNVAIHVQLLNSSRQLAVEQVYNNQTLVNNSPTNYSLTTPNNLQADNYGIQVLVQNSNNSTKALFPNLGALTVQ